MRRIEAVYGKCNNPYGHGHNYTVEVMLSGEVDPVTGMVCNLGDLDGFMRREIVDRFDEKNLNLDASFESLVPTTENLCVEIYGDHTRRLSRCEAGENSRGRNQQQFF